MTTEKHFEKEKIFCIIKVITSYGATPRMQFSKLHICTTIETHDLKEHWLCHHNTSLVVLQCNFGTVCRIVNEAVNSAKSIRFSFLTLYDLKKAKLEQPQWQKKISML